MTSFKAYLQNKGYVASSIQQVDSSANKFLEWLHHAGIPIERAQYKDLLDYIGYLQERGTSARRINAHLRGIRHYYSFLKLPHIALGVKLRGETQRTLPLFSADELDALYAHFTPRPLGKHRYTDKLILSFITYQGLEFIDVFRLRREHLKLQEGTLYVPGGIKRKASRTLNLEAHQVYPLQYYLNNHRWRYGTKLLSTACEFKGPLRHQFNRLSHCFKAQSAEIGFSVQRFGQLRQSRITLWVQQYGLRKAQYLAGMRSVKGTEYYLKNDPKDLISDIKQFHPWQ